MLLPCAEKEAIGWSINSPVIVTLYEEYCGGGGKDKGFLNDG